MRVLSIKVPIRKKLVNLFYDPCNLVMVYNEICKPQL